MRRRTQAKMPKTQEMTRLSNVKRRLNRLRLTRREVTKVCKYTKPEFGGTLARSLVRLKKRTRRSRREDSEKSLRSTMVSSARDADEELRSGTFCSRTVSWISAHLVWCWKSPGAAFGERFRNLSQQGAFNEERQGSFAGSNLPPCRVSNTKQQCPGAHCLPSVSKDATILAWVAGIRSSRRFRPRRDSWRTTRPSSRLTLGCSDPSGSRTSSRKTIQRRVRALVLDICLDRPPSLGTKIHRRCVAGLRCCFDRQRVATADEHDGCFVACSIFRC
ncbi:hypothetical protein BKA81DRAFT_416309 [Phyllosticta paracitricarpa]|uniref:Uncharacterized protein n=1 Tax=Phyllosticta citricarpa TaxID=55181 RepID=A0ABR1LYL0_9PEZI